MIYLSYYMESGESVLDHQVDESMTLDECFFTCAEFMEDCPNTVLTVVDDTVI